MSKICSVEGCDKPSAKRSYCNMHFLRWKRHGDPLATMRRTEANFCGKKECPAAKRVWGHVHYVKNSEVYRQRATEWQKNNPDSYERRKEAYFSREEVKAASRARTRKWAAKNPERKREMDLEFKAKNPAKVTSYKARYRAARRQATPPWLTDTQIAQIEAVYEEARRLSQDTGIPHEVDHIVPLAGKVVSGLHVPWNLRAIPKVANNRRPRIYCDEEGRFAGDISLDAGAEEWA